MNPISTLLTKYETLTPVKSRRTERGDLIDDFLKELNKDRKNFKPLNHVFLSRFFSDRKMSNSQIYCFYKDCLRAKNFSSYFWYKTKNNVNQDED